MAVKLIALFNLVGNAQILKILRQYVIKILLNAETVFIGINKLIIDSRLFLQILKSVMMEN